MKVKLPVIIDKKDEIQNLVKVKYPEEFGNYYWVDDYYNKIKDFKQNAWELIGIVNEDYGCHFGIDDSKKLLMLKLKGINENKVTFNDRLLFYEVQCPYSGEVMYKLKDRNVTFKNKRYNCKVKDFKYHDMGNVSLNIFKFGDIEKAPTVSKYLKETVISNIYSDNVCQLFDFHLKEKVYNTMLTSEHKLVSRTFDTAKVYYEYTQAYFDKLIRIDKDGNSYIKLKGKNIILPEIDDFNVEKELIDFTKLSKKEFDEKYGSNKSKLFLTQVVSIINKNIPDVEKENQIRDLVNGDL